LRLATESDFAGICEIVLHPGTLSVIQETLEEAKENITRLWAEDPASSDVRHFVIEGIDSDQFIAYVRLLYPFPQPPDMEPLTVWMSFLAVTPTTRGRGYGKRFMLMLVNAARECEHIRQFGMHTWSTNFPALRLYEGGGCRCVRREPFTFRGREYERLTLVQNV
jgi:ribosomal protein S18 acetylase RimI-like enzyme